MCERRSKVRDTDNTEKNVRATICSVFTPRRVHDIPQCLYAKSVKQILCGFERVCSHQSLFPPTVISAVVRMMKRKFATSRVFPILALPFQVSSQCFIEWSLPHSLVFWNVGILSSLFLSKTCESLRSGLKNLFALASVHLGDHHHCMPA